MDGYAVRAANTFGANESLPALLTVIAEVQMGQAAEIELGEHQAAVVHTGGMIPQTADAVVQIELTQTVGGSGAIDFPFEIEILRAVASGQNVLQVGEDVSQADEILPARHFLRPQDLGGLLALGITELKVTNRPKIAIIATGDEVVHPSTDPGPGQIRDINSYTIAAQTRQAGGLPNIIGIIPDELAVLKLAAAKALEHHDMVVMTAGSSVSVRDVTVDVINSLGEPGVLLHGIATRPGKPTIVGAVSGKPVLGLPGNPVSAMVQFAMVGMPTIYRLQGLPFSPRRGIVWAKISANIASETGREDYVPARLDDSPDGLLATPVFGKSNLIYTLVKADGLIKVPLNQGGLTAGEWVEVQLF
jgi:molybdopterin molybdotransferase